VEPPDRASLHFCDHGVKGVLITSRAASTLQRSPRPPGSTLDALQSFPGQRVHTKDVISPRRPALRKQKSNVVAARQRKEIEAVGLPPEKTPQPNVETLLVAFYGSSNDGMDHKGRAHALAKIFDCVETQHGSTPALHSELSEFQRR
jgi:hypothetical protein